MTLLRAESLEKRFGGLLAVDGVSLNVEQGEILGIIGPNGAGKSTLLDLLSRTQRANAGRVWFAERDIGPLPAHRVAALGLARTFQIVKPFANMTVRENVAVGALFGSLGTRRSARAAFAAADAVIERLGLQAYRARPASELTLAGRKRLEIAKALATSPKLMLLDEVMAGLNTAEVEEAMDLLAGINRDGITLVVVEHVMKAIMGLSSRVVVLHQGAVIAQGAPAAVAANPKVIEAYLGPKYAAAHAARQP